MMRVHSGGGRRLVVSVMVCGDSCVMCVRVQVMRCVVMCGHMMAVDGRRCGHRCGRLRRRRNSSRCGGVWLHNTCS